MPAGRLRKVIDWEQVDKLCALQCSQEEILAFLGGIDHKTLQKAIRREFGINYSQYYKEKSSQGLISLRRMQFTTAQKGNATMQIWLGKQLLNQRDKHDLTSSDGSMTPASPLALFEEELRRRHKDKPE